MVSSTCTDTNTYPIIEVSLASAAGFITVIVAASGIVLCVKCGHSKSLRRGAFTQEVQRERYMKLARVHIKVYVDSLLIIDLVKVVLIILSLYLSRMMGKCSLVTLATTVRVSVSTLRPCTVIQKLFLISCFKLNSHVGWSQWIYFLWSISVFHDQTILFHS